MAEAAGHDRSGGLRHLRHHQHHRMFRRLHPFLLSPFRLRHRHAAQLGACPDPSLHPSPASPQLQQYESFGTSGKYRCICHHL